MTEPNMNPQNDLLDNLLSDFLDESDELLTQLNRKLLELDEWVQSLDDGAAGRYDADLLNEMFRAAHSLKGLSAMFGLTDINNLTHKIENVFDAARKDQLAITPDVTELMFMGVDQLAALIELVKDPDREPVESTGVLERIGQVLRGAGAEKAQGGQKDVEHLWQDDAGSAPPEQPDPLAELTDEKDLPEKYLAIFVDETEVALDELSEILLAMEGGGNPDQVKSLLVTAHRIKGSAASIGLNRAAKLAHLMEDELQKLVEEQASLSTELTDALLGCTDALRQFISRLRQGEVDAELLSTAARRLLYGPHPASSSATQVPAGGASANAPKTFAQRLDSLVEEIRAGLKAVDAESVCAATGITLDRLAQVGDDSTDLKQLRELASYLDRPRTLSAPPALEPGEALYTGEVRFEAGFGLAGMKASLIYEKLQKLGSVSHCRPAAERLEDLSNLTSFSFRVRSSQPQERLAEQLRVAGVQHSMLQRLAESSCETASEPAPAPTPAAVDPTPSAQGKEAADAPVRNEAEREADPVGRSTPTDAARPAAVSKTATDAKSRSNEAGSRPVETLRVGIDRLDTLMNLAGQLVITKAQFAQITDKLQSALAGKQSLSQFQRVMLELDKLAQGDSLRVDGNHVPTQLRMFHDQAKRIQGDLKAVGQELQSTTAARDCVKELLETIHQLNRVSDGIQQAVMDTRMVPIGPMFARFNRVVRDIARAAGKEIRLNIRGEKTELDKRMIDELSDPLIHMVRNSADHGIESPDARQAAGKPREGTVTLEAFHRGNSIVIRVSDDGKGLDTEAIVRKCVKNGILNPGDADKMTAQDIYQMIWMPGMSTAEKITDVSGRGMGMDIVKSKIDALNGTVDIDSSPGRGTTMTIRLPVTLAILPSLMVEIGSGVFALPMESVAEIVSSRDHGRSSVHGKDVVVVRGRPISLVRLRELLNFNASPDPAGASDLEGAERESNLVIVGETGKGIGLAVDRVLGEEDVVIKSIAENYRNVPGIAGASILGNGRVALILDVPALIDMAASNAACATG